MAKAAQLQKLCDYIGREGKKAVLSCVVVADELTVVVKREALVPFMLFLRDDSECHFKLFIDACGVDYPDRPERFEVVYHLCSVKYNHRIRVKVTTDEKTPVPSITSVYRGAEWYEREAWDMYGIWFSDHPDLRRILTDYGFDGHPLRKDFPLTGYVEVRYDPEQQRVVYEPVNLQQEFRNFDFLSPWEGAHYIQPETLPGDEKAKDEKAA